MEYVQVVLQPSQGHGVRRAVMRSELPYENRLSALLQQWFPGFLQQVAQVGAVIYEPVGLERPRKPMAREIHGFVAKHP